MFVACLLTQVYVHFECEAVNKVWRVTLNICLYGVSSSPNYTPIKYSCPIKKSNQIILRYLSNCYNGILFVGSPISRLDSLALLNTPLPCQNLWLYKEKFTSNLWLYLCKEAVCTLAESCSLTYVNYIQSSSNLQASRRYNVRIHSQAS